VTLDAFPIAATSVTVAISTLGQGIRRIDLPDPEPGISYLVLHQRPEAGAGCARPDVTLRLLDSLGLSNSRNAALELAVDDLVLFADDDVGLNLEGIRQLAACFAEDPDLALAVGWRAEQFSADAVSAPLTRFNSGRVCAPEFMVRRSVIQALGVRFDPDFGLGARHGVGEDYVFVTDILRAGGKGWTWPVVTGTHPHASTGDRWDEPALLAARRAVLTRVFGRWAGPVRLAYALRHRRRFAGVTQLLQFVSG